jgi:hypothetical protein
MLNSTEKSLEDKTEGEETNLKIKLIIQRMLMNRLVNRICGIKSVVYLCYMFLYRTMQRM